MGPWDAEAQVGAEAWVLLHEGRELRFEGYQMQVEVNVKDCRANDVFWSSRKNQIGTRPCPTGTTRTMDQDMPKPKQTSDGG